MKELYSSTFYDGIGTGSYTSAKAVFNLLWQYYVPTSVVDIGCGNGVWLKAALEMGVQKIKGLEGDWVTKDVTVIPFENIQTTNLSNPFTVDGKFDLATSMEVVEHIPETSAKGFVESITRLAPVVLLSGGVPGQGGTSHINEQWPAYWAKLFREKGYVAFDVVRRSLWNDPAVEWWYRQNAIIYIEENFFNQMASRADLFPYKVEDPLPLVHPLFLAENNHPSLSRVIKDLLPGAVARAVNKRLPRT